MGKIIGDEFVNLEDVVSPYVKRSEYCDHCDASSTCLNSFYKSLYHNVK